MPKTKTRKTYKCGKCQQTGHNARTCTTGNVKAPINVTAEAAKVEEPKPVLVPMDGTQDLTEIRRGPSGRPKDAASPHTCPSCASIAVLVLVEYADGKTGLRCESCRNSTPIIKILKWGAVPADKPAQ